MKPNIRTGNDFSPTTSSPEDIVAALLYLYSLQTDNEQQQHDTIERNGMGFNAYDASILSSIAEQVIAKKAISDRQVAVLRHKLTRYAKQVRGVDLTKYHIKFTQSTFIPNAMKPQRGELRATALDGNTIKLEFGYDDSLIIRVKALSGRKYNAQGTFWTCPATKGNIAQLINMGFPIPPEFDRANRVSVDLDFSGLRKELRPYQMQGAIRAADDLNLRALIADEMGLGKTCQALAAIWSRRNEALPALIICPGSLKWNWAREVAMWLPGVAIRILSGYTTRRSFRVRDQREITIVNYDVLSNRENKNGDVTHQGWGELLKESGFKTIVLDECHKIKNYKSKRTKSILDMVKAMPNRLALSGTPIESRPMEFYTTLQVVSPNLFPNFWEFGTRYCGAVSDGYGTKFTGATNIQELNQILTDNVMIRRRKADVLTDLPPKVRSVVPVEIDMRAYHKAENQLMSAIQEMTGRLGSGDQANVLAQMEKCKQAAMQGKMDFAIEYIEDYLESGRKLVVFATHTFTLDKLEKAFSRRCTRVDGSVVGIKRQQAVDKFQGDEKTTLFLGNLQAAGVGLTLTAASDTLTLELGWTPGAHDQAEDRVHRIGQEADSVNAIYMIARGTVEEEIMKLLDEKRKVLAQALDGQEVSQRSLLTELIAGLAKRFA